MVIKSQEISRLRYPVPKSFTDAAGMLKGKLSDGVKYQKKLRQEWVRRENKLKRYLKNASS